MILVRDDFVRGAVQTSMERLKADPGGAIDNESVRAALLRQAQATWVTFGSSGSAKRAAARAWRG